MIYKSPIKINSVEQSLDKNIPVILVGFKIEGLLAFHWLKEHGYRILAIVSKENAGARYFDIPIISETDLPGFCQNFVQILIAVKFQEAFCTRVQKMGLKNIRLISALKIFGEMSVDISDIPQAGWILAGTKRQSEKSVRYALDVFVYECLKNSDGRLIIPTIDIVVTEKCSLRCRDCSNLMQYYTTTQIYDAEHLAMQFDIIARLADNIGDVHILGGEPFVYDHLHELLLRLSRNKGQYGRLKLFTNGTIVPADSLLEVFVETDSFISISDYGKHSPKIPSLIAKMSMYGIDFEIKTINSWQRCGYFVTRTDSPENLKNKFDGCCAKDLLTIQDGSLFLCPFISNAVRLGAVKNIPGYGIVIDHSLSKQALYDFIATPGWKSGICRHCPGRGFNAETVEPAIQTASPLHLEIKDEKI